MKMSSLMGLCLPLALITPFQSQAATIKIQYQNVVPSTTSSCIQKSPFKQMHIKTDDTHLVNMTYGGIHARAINGDDLAVYEQYFSKTPVIAGNYFGNGVGREKARIDAAFSLWSDRWKAPFYEQSHYQGGFLVYYRENENPFAHIVDGFISNDVLTNIMESTEESFDDHKGLLGQFKSTVKRLVESQAKGYSQASLDFTGADVGFFVKDKKRIQQLTLLQDTYMHQLSYLGYNWGVESALGRVVAQASKPVMAKNFIEAYEAKGYYAFKMKEKMPFGEDEKMVEFVNLIKPVNPLQTYARFSQDKEGIKVSLHLMSYFTTYKPFTFDVIYEKNGMPEVLQTIEYTLYATSPGLLTFKLENKFADKQLWVRATDADGILDPYLIPLKVNVK